MAQQYPQGCGFDLWPRSVGEGSSIAISCGVGHKCSSDPALLWLWCKPAAAAPIGPLAWELSHATGSALKRKKKKTFYFYLLISFSPKDHASVLIWLIVLLCLKSSEVSTVVQQVKDLPLLQLWLRFDSCPETSTCCGWGKKKKRKQKFSSVFDASLFHSCWLLFLGWRLTA